MRDKLRILLVEDNPGDARLTKIALERGALSTDLVHVDDGEEALDYLHRRGIHRAAWTPDLIVLDLNLPGRDGREILREIKLHPTLRVIPVVILTTSDAERDILDCYGAYANSYITKPIDVPRFSQVLSNLHEYWCSNVELPPIEGASG